jgi:hypothetical protein
VENPEHADFILVYHPVQRHEDLDSFIFPDPDEPWRFDFFHEMVEKYGDELFIPSGIGLTLFEIQAETFTYPRLTPQNASVDFIRPKVFTFFMLVGM